MAETTLNSPRNSGALNANAVHDVSIFERFTVYAVAATTVQLSADNGATWSATVAIPAAGYLTISDLADAIKANAAYRVVGFMARPR